MLGFKSGFVRTLLYFHLFGFGISAISAQNGNKTVSTELHFPKPNPSIFKSNEIGVLDSLIAVYKAPKNFLNDMMRFAKDDSVNNRTQFDIIFTGSSSFAKWKSLPVDMAPLPALNRGFGGSKILDMVYFSNAYLFHLHPKLIFVYVGNDIVESDSNIIILLFRYLEQVYHGKLPKTKIIFCGINKSIARKAHSYKVDVVNEYLQSALSKMNNCGYLELCRPMLDEFGKPNPEYFVADSSHLNTKGYDIWKMVVKARLEKEFKNDK